MMKGMALCTAALLVAGMATAEKAPEHDGSTVFDLAGACPLDGYKAWDSADAAGDIPDNDPAGRSFSVMTVDDGDCFGDVTLVMDIEHTWIGDLVLNVTYLPSDGSPAVGPVDIMCRPGDNDCGVDGGFGCSGDFLPGAVVTFNASGGDLAADCGAGDIAGGCYAPVGDMSVFDGLPKGGTFEFNISDNAGGDLGLIRSATLYSLNIPCTVPVEDASWGAVKATFGE